ncbi:MAG: PTS sugar transporter subunit IIA [Desulfobacteraceae bacterium]|nr:MAG: PTS sugar transporter subunit IIA [Desulfobacteraceae bacterium]
MNRKKAPNNNQEERNAVGVLIITHGPLARELVQTAELIVGKVEQLRTLSVDSTFDVDLLNAQVQEAITAVDRGRGTIILTDLFGGTPSNISLSFLEEGKVDVVTGVNLPMLIKLAQAREGKDLADVARLCYESGREGVYMASEILKK